MNGKLSSMTLTETNMSNYSDIVSDGGMDPRNEYEKERKSHKMNEADEKIIELLEMIVKQNEEIIKNQNIWRTFPTVLVPPSIDPHFGKDIPYVPYKGPDCTTGNNIEYIRNENSVCGGVRTTTPIYSTSYDGTKTILPVNTLPDNE
jgi:hypothetical protein